MKPSLELYKLIKSLTKSEKRFFKLSSSLQSGEKNYLKIFDFIDRHELYDEEQLKKYFSKEKFIQHLPSEKNHLYKLILKSLRQFYSEQSVSSILKQEIKNVEILYSKALYKECEKFVYRAKELAKENEKFYYWYELISWEKRLLEEAYEAGEFNLNLDDLVAEEEEVISKLRNLADYQIIYSKINLIYRSGGFTRTEDERKIVEEIANHPLIKGKNTALSSRAASICYYIKGLCAATNRDYQDSYAFFNRTREILDLHPNIKEDSAQRYVTTLSHLLRCYIDSRDFDKAHTLIQEMRGLLKEKGFDSTDIQVRLFSSTYNLELTLYHRTGEFQKCIDLMPEIQKQLTSFGDKINKETTVLFNYNIAYSYFGFGDYKKSVTYLNQVLNDNENNLRQDIYSFSRIFNLILHYELGNYDYLEYIIKSTSRYLSKQEKGFEGETLIIKHIRKLAKAANTQETIPLLQNFKADFDELLQNQQKRILLEYFHLYAWIDSKINKRTFSEAMAKTEG